MRPFDFNPPANGGLRAHAARSFVVTLTAQGFKFLLRLLSMVVLARLLTPGDYGLVAIATSVTSVLGAIREAGLSSATIQRPEITDAQVSSLFWLNVFLGCAIALVCLVVAGPVATFFNHNELGLIIPALGGVGLIGSFGVQHTALMQRKMQFRELMVRDLLGAVAGLGVAIFVAYRGWGVWSLVMLEATTALVSTATIWLGCNWRPSAPGNFREAKSLVQFGAHVTGGALIHHISRGLDTVILGAFFGNVTVGLYSRAQQLLSTPMAQIVGPVMSVARPALSRAAQSTKRLSRATTDLLRLTSFCSAAVVGSVVPISDGIVRYALGVKWMDSAVFFAGLAPFALVESCGALLASVMVASGRPGALLKWRFFSVLITFGGLLIGVSWGAKGVAIAYGLSGLLIRVPLLLVYVSRVVHIPLSSLFGAIGYNVLFAVAACVSGYIARKFFIDPTELVAVAIVVFVSTSVFLLVSFSSKSGRAVFLQIHDLLVSVRKRRV